MTPKSMTITAFHKRNNSRIFTSFGIAPIAQVLKNRTKLLLGEIMYGYRNNHVIRNFILTFLAGWIFGQIFTIQPKAFLVNLPQPIQQKR